MVEEMNTIPPRVNALERETHTLAHRVAALEESHRDMPHRLTVLEMAVERLPKIEDRLASMTVKLNQIFYTLSGFGMAFGAWQLGPDIIKFLGGR